MTRKQILENILCDMATIRRRMMAKHSDNHCPYFTMAQGNVLRTIKQNEGIGVKDLAEKLAMTPSAITQIVEALVEKDYIFRIQDKLDKRAISLKLSEKSILHLQDMEKQINSKISKIFDCLTSEELTEYYRLTKKITENI